MFYPSYPHFLIGNSLKKIFYTIVQQAHKSKDWIDKQANKNCQFFSENGCAQIKGKELSLGLRSQVYDPNDHFKGLANSEDFFVQFELYR